MAASGKSKFMICGADPLSSSYQPKFLSCPVFRAHWCGGIWHKRKNFFRDIARIYELFPLLCPKCGGQMRLIAFNTEGAQIRKILDRIGVDSEPPDVAPVRGPPLWDDCDSQTDEGVHI
jgi:hypothetical protein